MQATGRWQQLNAVLDETAAYRKHFRRVTADKALPPRQPEK